MIRFHLFMVESIQDKLFFLLLRCNYSEPSKPMCFSHSNPLLDVLAYIIFVVQFKASFSAGPVRRKHTPSAQPQQLFTWHECVTPNSSKEVRRDLRMAAMVFHCRLPGGSSVLRDVFFRDLYAGKIKQSQTH